MNPDEIEIDLDSDDELDLRVPSDGLTQQDSAQDQFDADFAAANGKHREMKARRDASTGNVTGEPGEEERRNNSSELRKFVDDRSAKWSLKTVDGRNFLHYLAYKDLRRDSAPKWLMQLAILSRPELMRDMDSKKRTPLTGMQHEVGIRKQANVPSLTTVYSFYCGKKCTFLPDRRQS